MPGLLTLLSEKDIRHYPFVLIAFVYLRRLKRKVSILSPSVCLYPEVSTRTNELLRNPVKVFRGGVGRRREEEEEVDQYPIKDR